MNYKSFPNKATKSFFIAFLTSALSFGAVIYDSGIIALKATDPSQLGRLNRSGVPSDWSAPKAFPGVVNLTTSYYYETLNIPTSPFPYLQIWFEDLTRINSTSASAYLDSYHPSSTGANRGLDVNYLGDAGSSTYFGGTDPVIFQIVMPSGPANQLLVVVNETTAATNVNGEIFRVRVEGFYDTNFNDITPPVPEPATMALSGAGFAVVGIAAYRRKQNKKPTE